MILRKANINDCELYFDWANDELARQNAFNTKSIDWETHQKWFKDKLRNKNSILYLVEGAQNKVGQVRFDCFNNEATIDYSIDNQFRGQGQGKKTVKMAIKQLQEDYSDIKIIVAKVKQNNLTSNKIFLGLNFHEQNRAEESKIIVYQLRLSQVKTVG